MNSAIIQLIVLAGVAIFLILRLKSVLGTRDGFERPALPVAPDKTERPVPRLVNTTPGAGDDDITDHVTAGSPAAMALAAMKRVEPSFGVGEFLRGARGAYEMILMAFQNGDLAPVERFLSPQVAASFHEIVDSRKAKGLVIEANFIGIREIALTEASFDEASRTAEISVRFVGEITSVVRDAKGDIVEGDPQEIRRQKDVWTFSRKMGASDPNWQLAETGE
ncbi:Tim44/TimA family putative adaptor protein [Solirhodobacter olei]|jgi:predicted lipid-binding transport protein (Tim44 family)|uniref:Tim44/TimA family putative adaptor protein n=1 Tax=Solirhodobacter olei TaxID=2493082 RepID=UPI000FDCD2BF|nr:Tim44/TimA family putative adaptor protein [Solirhodobacter olei]